jgi:hypothetical protein
MKTQAVKAALSDTDSREKLLDELVERAKPYLRASLAQWLNNILARSTARSSPTHSFGLTFQEFVEFSEEEQIAWGHEVLALEKGWLDEQIAKRNAEWILVVGGKVVKSSSNLEKLPSKEEIYRIARERGFAPFVYTRELLIEESAEAFRSCSWSRLSLSDFYPTIGFFIGRSDWGDTRIISEGKQIVADFDTGCPALIVNETEIDERVLSGIESRLFSTHLDRSYDYRACKVKVAVQTKEGRIKAQPFLIRLVRNWRQSAFCAINPERKALAGRELCLRLLVNVLLKADTKETEIIA